MTALNTPVAPMVPASPVSSRTLSAVMAAVLTATFWLPTVATPVPAQAAPAVGAQFVAGAAGPVLM